MLWKFYQTRFFQVAFSQKNGNFLEKHDLIHLNSFKPPTAVQIFGGIPIVLIIIKKLDLCSDKKRNCLMNRYNNSCRAPNDKFKQLYNHYFYIFDIQSIQMQTIKMRIKLQRT
jgi:hypothetical protein